MKIYKLEPTNKKSVCEVEFWRKSSDILPNENNDSNSWYHWGGPVLRKECWWRWAEWTILIPQTEEEIKSFLQERNFETLEAYLDHHGVSSIEDKILPDEDEDEHILSSEAECHYCWDGQGTLFKIEETANLDLSEEERYQLESEAMRIYLEDEMYEEGLESLGWEHVDTIYEVYCTMKVTLQENDEEKYQRELSEFHSKIQTNFGGIFHKSKDKNETEYQLAIQKFGMKQVLQLIDECVPVESTILHDGIHVQPFLMVALCDDSELDVIFHLLRKCPAAL